jgi:hypothetical protein
VRKVEEAKKNRKVKRSLRKTDIKGIKTEIQKHEEK